MRPLTKSQAVCLTVMTGTLCMNPKEFREEIEKKLGRVVAPAEYATQSFTQELQEAYEDAFIELCQTVEDSGIVLMR